MGREEQQQVCNIPTWRRLCTWANKSGSRHHESPPRDVLIVSFAHGFDCIFGSTSFFLESSGPGDDFWDHPKPAWYLLCFQGFRGKIHILSTLVFLQVLNMVTHEDHLNRLCGMSKVLLPTSSSVPFLSCNEKEICAMTSGCLCCTGNWTQQAWKVVLHVHLNSVKINKIRS